MTQVCELEEESEEESPVFDSPSGTSQVILAPKVIKLVPKSPQNIDASSKGTEVTVFASTRVAKVAFKAWRGALLKQKMVRQVRGAYS